jgi:hypothetical protein
MGTSTRGLCENKCGGSAPPVARADMKSQGGRIGLCRPTWVEAYVERAIDHLARIAYVVHGDAPHASSTSAMRRVSGMAVAIHFELCSQKHALDDWRYAAEPKCAAAPRKASNDSITRRFCE